MFGSPDENRTHDFAVTEQYFTIKLRDYNMSVPILKSELLLLSNLFSGVVGLPQASGAIFPNV